MSQPVARIVHTHHQLATQLADWPNQTAETTWALVFIGAIPSGAELAAAREAAKLCDAVACVRLQPTGKNYPIPPQLPETARAAGIDILWVPNAKEKPPIHIDVGVDDVNATQVAQALYTVLPLLVVVPRGNVPLIRTLRNLQTHLANTFTLRLTTA
ncbi:MAG: hypothetical protein EBR79_01555 [Proteobacteria bacterium]|nr:hypothetical protein [Pseudomonadota bacterium]NBX85723.1 hypothetical protein [Pseudomonadota bacterium]